MEEFTFLATDMVGSSELHRRFPDVILATMDRHDDIIRRCVRQCAGDPFKHTGDGFVAVFDRPGDALHAARLIQLEMRAADWDPMGRPQIRCGIHIGLARPRGNDYFGPAMSMVQRLEGAANADQILASEVVFNRVGDRKDGHGASFRDLGKHHFKGVELIRVFQVLGEGLPSEFPPISGKRESSYGNLPADLSTFVGRTVETADLRRLIQQARVTTLVGPGGIGKTRLAIETLRMIEAEFVGGVWMMQLSALERKTDLWPVLAGVLSIEAAPGVDPRIQVIDRLEDLRALILLDNCEHLLDPAAELAENLCSACTGVSIVATSRQLLGIPGEAIFEVPPLTPSGSETPGQSVAVDLFVDRAQLIRHQFDPDDGDLRTIAHICDNLDHIPLAIELAAGQMRRYPLDRIARDAKNPLDLAQTRGRRGASRQQTLRRALEWSYDLIDDRCRTVFQRLSVFSGPFHEEQAMAVCAPDMADEVAILDSIDDLIDASLLNARSDGSRRMRMLRTVQAFGREKLRDHNTLEAIERRHAEVLSRRAETLSEAFAGDGEADAVAAFAEEMDNLRTAFDRALATDLTLAAKLAMPMLFYNYYHRGAETAAWPGRIMAQPGADDLPTAPRLLAAAASHAFHESGNPGTAHTFLERGFAAEAAGGQGSGGWLPHVAGQIAFWSRQIPEFFALHERTMEEAGAHGEVACQIIDMSAAAFVKASVEDTEGARALVADLQRLGDRVRQPSLIGYIHFAQGGVAGIDNPDVALAELRSAIEWAAIGGNALGVQRINRIMADFMAERAGPLEALKILSEALTALPEQGATMYVWTTIGRMLISFAKVGAFEQIATLAAAMEASPVPLGRSARAAMAQARGSLSPELLHACTEKGTSFHQKEARHYAINVVRGLSH
ncbi:MAG: hypothetical protein AAGA05_01020 [Pseudomonadota bacterium]